MLVAGEWWECAASACTTSTGSSPAAAEPASQVGPVDAHPAAGPLRPRIPAPLRTGVLTPLPHPLVPLPSSSPSAVYIHMHKSRAWIAIVKYLGFEYGRRVLNTKFVNTCRTASRLDYEIVIHACVCLPHCIYIDGMAALVVQGTLDTRPYSLRVQQSSSLPTTPPVTTLLPSVCVGNYRCQGGGCCGGPVQLMGLGALLAATARRSWAGGWAAAGCSCHRS